MAAGTHILVVDDDPHIREVMRFALTKAGYRVSEAADGSAAYAAIQLDPPALVVLDIIMPEDDGLALCRKLRAESRLPIIFVSSRDDELDRVLGLELGADDYLTKPFSPRELAARVAAVLRRSEPRAPSLAGEVLVRGAVRLDVARHKCYVGERELALTVTEFELLRALLTAPGRVLSRAQLVELAYGPGHFISDRTVDSHVRRLRAKLGEAAALVETVYGVGYRLSE
ncbi:MAG TPA: response regulator transcription factor [Polyangiaceae bacterium]|nr:response regulator transcription factor [Polyangiaceae bacterium]